MKGRTLILGVGDLSAEPGSQQWAIRVRAEIQVAIKNTSTDRKQLDEWLRIMQKYSGYKSLEDSRGRPFTSYEMFCVEKVPWGLGYSTKDLDRIVAERKTAAAIDAADRAAQRPAGRPKIFDNVQDKKAPTGNAIAATLRRLRKDRPDLLAKVIAGEMSANAAAIEAGFRSKTITVRVTSGKDTRGKISALESEIFRLERAEVSNPATEPLRKVNELQQTLGWAETRMFDLMPLQLINVVKNKYWQRCVDKNKKPFASFEAFVTHRLPQGLETTIEDLLTFCRMSALRSKRRQMSNYGTDAEQLIKKEIGASQPKRRSA